MNVHQTDLSTLSLEAILAEVVYAEGLAPYLEDMQQALERITRYLQRQTFDTFEQNELLVDGIVRNLELLGEAAKHVPQDIRSNHPSVPWTKIAGLRDIL